MNIGDTRCTELPEKLDGLGVRLHFHFLSWKQRFPGRIGTGDADINRGLAVRLHAAYQEPLYSPLTILLKA